MVYPELIKLGLDPAQLKTLGLELGQTLRLSDRLAILPIDLDRCQGSLDGAKTVGFEVGVHDER